MTSGPLTRNELSEFCSLVDSRSVVPELAVFYRAGYLESVIHSMGQDVPGVAEYMRNRMEILKKTG